MHKICLAFWKSEHQYAYKRHAYEKKHVIETLRCISQLRHIPTLD